MEDSYQIKAFDMILDRLHALESKQYEYTTIYCEVPDYPLEFYRSVKAGWIPEGSPVVTQFNQIFQNMKKVVNKD